MTTPRPDAYLLPLPTEDFENRAKKSRFIDHCLKSPLGATIPFRFNVQWVDADGAPTKLGRISGTIETIIEIEGEAPIVVFSTGEKISLSVFGE